MPNNFIFFVINNQILFFWVVHIICYNSNIGLFRNYKSANALNIIFDFKIMMAEILVVYSHNVFLFSFNYSINLNSVFYNLDKFFICEDLWDFSWKCFWVDQKQIGIRNLNKVFVKQDLAEDCWFFGLERVRFLFDLCESAWELQDPRLIL